MSGRRPIRRRPFNRWRPVPGGTTCPSRPDRVTGGAASPGTGQRGGGRCPGRRPGSRAGLSNSPGRTDRCRATRSPGGAGGQPRTPRAAATGQVLRQPDGARGQRRRRRRRSCHARRRRDGSFDKRKTAANVANAPVVSNSARNGVSIIVLATFRRDVVRVPAWGTAHARFRSLTDLHRSAGRRRSTLHFLTFGACCGACPRS